MGKWLKWIGILLLTPISLVVLLFILLYIPPIQNFLREEATVYASKATGMQVNVDRISLAFPLDLLIKGVEVISASDTLLSLENLKIKVQLLPLLRGQVEVDGIILQQVSLHSAHLIKGMRLEGVLGELLIESHGVNLITKEVLVNKLELKDTDVRLFLNDSTDTASDTTSSAINWKIILQTAHVANLSFQLAMPHDSLQLAAHIGTASLQNGAIDLAQQAYQLARISLSAGSMNYDLGTLPSRNGFDPTHLALRNIQLSIDSARYQGLNMLAVIRDCSLSDRSGLSVSSLSGRFFSDSTAIRVPLLSLQTPHSDLTLQAKLDWTALQNREEGELQAKLSAHIGKQDVLLAVGTLPDAVEKAYPFRPVLLNLSAEGNFKKLLLSEFKTELPGAFAFSAQGEITNLLDSLHRKGVVELDLKTQNLNFLTAFIDASQSGRYAIPFGLQVNGTGRMDEGRYAAHLALTDNQGKVSFDADYNQHTEAYHADLSVDKLQLDRFLPKDSLYQFTFSAHAKGQGSHFFASQTTLDAQVDLLELRYGSYTLSHVTLDAELRKSAVRLVLDSQNALLDLQAKLSATLHPQKVVADLSVKATDIDFQKLNLVPKRLSTSLLLSLHGESNLKQTHSVEGAISDWTVTDEKGVNKLKELLFSAQTDKDTTWVKLSAGDMILAFNGDKGIEKLGTEFAVFAGKATHQLEKGELNLMQLRNDLPEVHLSLSVGKDNPLNNSLNMVQHIDFSRLYVDLSTSPRNGINGHAHLYSLAMDSMQLDTIDLALRQDTLAAIHLNAAVINGATNPQFVFQSYLEGVLSDQQSQVMLKLLNNKGKTGFLLGCQAHKEDDGFVFNLFPDRPILAFRPFSVNKNNRIFISKEKKISANLLLRDEDGAGLLFRSLNDSTLRQQLELALTRIDLSELTSLIPYSPELSGMLSANVNYLASDTSFQVKADLNVNKLMYEKQTIGDVGLKADYLPGGKGMHQIGVHLFHNEREVATASGAFQAGNEGGLSSRLVFHSLPLALVNPFIPMQMAEVSGALQGELSVNGAPSKPSINGYMVLDSASVLIAQVGARFRFDDKRIEITDSRLMLNSYTLLAAGKNPFVIDGWIDFSDFSKMMAELNLNASNYQLLNASRTKNSLVYGKLFVDINSSIHGQLDALVMRGNIRLLGNTDVTYVLKDSPLTVQDRLGDLVTFVNFSDTTSQQQEQPSKFSLGGIDVLMTIRVEPAVRLKVDLTPDRESRIELEGGGDLSLQYTPQGDLFLSGRYTLSSGMVKYNYSMLLDKSFTIQNGSYVDWTGNVMDPMLKITAIERVRTSVTLDNQAPRSVNFDVGITIQNQLENLALVFNLSAPEDITIQNQLTAMTEEERSKQAVTMLATGMYLAPGASTGGINMGGYLNSFLQNEISNLAGSAFKTVDVSVGMETVDGGDGGSKRTDYSFQISKRFYNDRISVMLGGRISTGNTAEQSQSFIDNISLEYRLDSSGTRYVRLFHDKDYESILEGEITETGVGLVLRKKMRRLGELFVFKKQSSKKESKLK